jgi:hypothetical protein
MNPSPSDPSISIDSTTDGVSWAAIVAGAVAAAALTLMLVALGAGLGLSSVSPWSGSGVSATTFKVGTGIYLLIVAVMASSIGGYLAARLRTTPRGFHTNEVFFRDTATGLVTWAFATILSAVALGSVTASIAGGASQALGAGASATAPHTGPVDLAVDNLFRTNPAASPAAGPAPESRAELSRLLTASFGRGGTLNAEDRTYVARVIAARTGLSQADADARLTTVINEMKQALDTARKGAAQFSLWLTASLLFGAFAASVAAVEGGQLRDGTWNNKKLTPRAIWGDIIMGRSILLWLVGVPIPIIILLALFMR